MTSSDLTTVHELDQLILLLLDDRSLCNAIEVSSRLYQLADETFWRAKIEQLIGVSLSAVERIDDPKAVYLTFRRHQKNDDRLIEALRRNYIPLIGPLAVFGEKEWLDVALIRAMNEGRWLMVDKLVTLGATPNNEQLTALLNEAVYENVPPLFAAIAYHYYYNTKFVCLLLAYGEDIAAENYRAIMAAIDDDKIDILRLLLRYCPEFTIDRCGEDLYEMAFSKNALGVTELLLTIDRQPDYNQYLVKALICEASFPIIKYLLDCGADPTANNHEALYQMVVKYNERYDRLALLIERSKDRITTERLALHYAVFYGTAGIVEKLLKRGIDPNNGPYGEPLLFSAILSPIHDLMKVDLLVNSGANLTNYASNLMRLAVHHNKYRILAYLAHKGVPLTDSLLISLLRQKGGLAEKILTEYRLPISADFKEKVRTGRILFSVNVNTIILNQAIVLPSDVKKTT